MRRGSPDADSAHFVPEAGGKAALSVKESNSEERPA
jgi:hypothetical protein